MLNVAGGLIIEHPLIVPYVKEVVSFPSSLSIDYDLKLFIHTWNPSFWKKHLASSDMAPLLLAFISPASLVVFRLNLTHHTHGIHILRMWHACT